MRRQILDRNVVVWCCRSPFWLQFDHVFDPFVPISGIMSKLAYRLGFEIHLFFTYPYDHFMKRTSWAHSSQDRSPLHTFVLSRAEGPHFMKNLTTHYYISIQNPTEKSNGAWISLFKLTKNHKNTFFFVNLATSVTLVMAIPITVG